MIIPQIFKGIKTLHAHKIFHCDLKPENIFWLDANRTDLVIGDYGSAKTFEETSAKQLTHTSTTKGTNFYLAPEQPRGIVSEKNDYYSLGMILLHLLYPQLVNRESLHKIIERQYERRPIIDYDAKYGKVNDLIAGLTLADVSGRWGEKQVAQWLRGGDIQVEYAHENEVTPIKLGGAMIRTSSQLVQYIEDHADWYEDLIEDQEGHNLLLRWVAEVQDLKQKRIFENMVKQYRQEGIEFLTQAVIRYFTPDYPIMIDMKRHDLWNVTNLEETFHQVLQHVDDIYQITATDKMKFCLFQIEFALRQIQALHDPQNQRVAKNILTIMEATFHLSAKATFDDYLCQCYLKITNRLALPMVLYEYDHKTAMQATLDVKQDIDRQLKEWGIPSKHEDAFQVVQLCATRGDGAFGVPLLRELILKMPAFFERAQGTPVLNNAPEISALLHELSAINVQAAEQALNNVQQMLKNTQPMIAQAERVAVKTHESFKVIAHYRRIEAQWKQTREELQRMTYKQMLDVPAIAGNAANVGKKATEVGHFTSQIEKAFDEIDRLEGKKKEGENHLSDNRHKQGMLQSQIPSEGTPGWLFVVCYLIPPITLISILLFYAEKVELGNLFESTILSIFWPILLLVWFSKGDTVKIITVVGGIFIAIGVWIYVSQRFAALREQQNRLESEITHDQSSLNDLENRIREGRDSIQRSLREIQRMNN